MLFAMDFRHAHSSHLSRRALRRADKESNWDLVHRDIIPVRLLNWYGVQREMKEEVHNYL